MSNTDPTFAPGSAGFNGNTATGDTAFDSTVGGHTSAGQAPTTGDQAADVKAAAAAAGQHAAGVTKDQLRKVGSETKRQAKDLYQETQMELAEQAASQQKRVATGIRSLADELGEMAGSSETQGVASDLAQQAATRAAGIADWLDQRDPGSLLSEVKNYARRKPGTFIAIAAVAGVLAGRLTRGVIEEKKDAEEDSTGQFGATPGYAATDPGYAATNPDYTANPGYTSDPDIYSANPNLGGMPR